MIYVISLAGIKSGRLKKEISWTHPIFVAFFNNELNDGTTGSSDTPIEIVVKEGNIDRYAGVTDQDRTDNSGEAGGSTGDGRSDTAIDETVDGGESVDKATEESTSENQGMQGVDDGYDSNSEYYVDNEYQGQVEYVKVDMRHARSGYYSNFDTIALSSKLNYINVDNDYFSNACFIGDSRMEGLYFYGDLKEADYYYKPGVTVYDLMSRKLSYNGAGGDELPAALSRKQYAHIYMMVGVNELGDKTPDEYARAYSDDISIIRQLQPDALIFIIGMMHVTSAYSSSSDVFNNDNIDARNTAVAAIANGKDIFYLDMNECVDDGNGGVINEYSYDGVHLKAEYYKLWTEWMKAHGIKNLIK